jgi:hypothetical protein
MYIKRKTKGFSINKLHSCANVFELNISFPKITRPLIKKCRGEGKNILMYLDDGLGSHPDEDVCTAMAAQAKQDLILSEFVPKNEKSTWQPIRQRASYLGKYITG